MTSRHLITIQRVSRVAGIPSERQFHQWLNAALPRTATLSLRIVNAAEGGRLNAAFRGKANATNVLTFVYHQRNAETLEGDIVLCAQVVAREAREQAKARAAHYAHLTVHGALHLAGFDHATVREAKIMEAREIAILAKLGIANPYA